MSCSQVSKLLDIRKKLGVTSGGIPPCAACETNNRDIVTSDDVRPAEPVELMRIGASKPDEELPPLKGVTPIVKPKDELMTEVVRRVIEELRQEETGWN